MYRPLRIASLVALGACLAAPAALAHAQCDCPAEAITAVGHRGTGTDGAFPENTLPAFAQGVLEGATMVELDVQHTSDGALIVMHDDTVNRTTEGEGCVAELTLAEIQALDAGGERAPTLAEVFDAIDVGINIEIKVNEDASCPMTDRARLAADVAAVIAADGGSREVLVSSFDLDQLLALKAVDDSVPLAYLTTGIDGYDVAIDNGFAAVHPLQVSVRRVEVDRAHAAGLEVNPWTVNDDTTVRRLAGMGVDRIITDDPDLVLTSVAAYCASLVCDDGGVDAGGGGGDAGPDGADAAPDAGGGGSGGGCAVSPGASPSSAGVLFGLVVGLLVARRRAHLDVLGGLDEPGSARTERRWQGATTRRCRRIVEEKQRSQRRSGPPSEVQQVRRAHLVPCLRETWQNLRGPRPTTRRPVDSLRFATFSWSRTPNDRPRFEDTFERSSHCVAAPTLLEWPKAVLRPVGDAHEARCLAQPCPRIVAGHLV